jgi:cytochrome c oxidase subunit 1
MLMAVGFLITFLIGGLTGIFLASPPLDFFTHDTYFVVAHFHSIVMALVLGAFGGLYYWGPKITGYMLNETYRQDPVLVPLHWHPGLHDPGYILGLDGMPRRVAIYPHDPQWQT